jgi:hypothetical protein
VSSSSDTTILQDLLTNDVVDLSDFVTTTSLSIMVTSEAAVDRIQFQWELENGEIMTTTETFNEAGQAVSSSSMSSYLTTPGVKAVIIDVFAVGSDKRFCRKILPFFVIEFSGDSAVQDKICEKWVVRPASVEEEQPTFIHIAPLYLH